MKSALALLAILALMLTPVRAEDWARAQATCQAVFQTMKPAMNGMLVQLRGDGADYMLLAGNREQPGAPNQSLVIPFGQSIAFLGKKQNVRFTAIPGQLGTVGFYVETGFVLGGLGNAPAADHAIVLAQPGASVRFVAPDLAKAAAALKAPATH